eukprot:snap_masked-scaffold_4-processed-gene-3.27-mRNA-1 protein AED:1.00 eAED:1.00 QI:0/0/0/0/1/1/2/0/492
MLKSKKNGEEANANAAPIDFKPLVRNLVSAISKNTSDRLKYLDKPEKFMDSELKLFESLENLKPISSEPNHYHLLLSHLPLFLSLLQHENSDIVLNFLNFFQQLTDTDLLENLEDIELSGFQSLVSRISKPENLLFETLSSLLTETNKQQNEIIYSIFENFLSYNSIFADLIIEKTRVLNHSFSVLSEYSTEEVSSVGSFLFSLLSTQEKNHLTKKRLDFLGRKFESVEEEEFIQNILDTLLSQLSLNDEKLINNFITLEGFELMFKFISQRHQIYPICLSIISSCLEHFGVKSFIEKGGLGIIFSVFLKKALKFKIKRGNSKVEKEEVQTVIIEIFFKISLVSDKKYFNRFAQKFLEKKKDKYEKLDEIILIFIKSKNSFQEEKEKDIELKKVEVEKLSKENEVDDKEAEYILNLRLGLEGLEKVCFIIGKLILDNTLGEFFYHYLKSIGISFVEIGDILEQFGKFYDEDKKQIVEEIKQLSSTLKDEPKW